MSCGCNCHNVTQHIRTCGDNTPCNCCTPCPPVPLPECPDPEPCDVAVDSNCVIYTGGDLDCIGITAGEPPLIRLNTILEAIDAAVCNTTAGAVFVTDTDCVHTTGHGTQLEPLVISPVVSSTTGNILSCDATGLLATVTTENTDCITITGDGTIADPFHADVIISPVTGNLTECAINGIKTLLHTTNTNCIHISGNGTTGSPLSATPVISSASGNQLTCTSGGLFVAPASGNAIVTNDQGCMRFQGDGTLADPLSVVPVIANTVGNLLSCTAGGLETKVYVQSTECVGISGAGTSGDPIMVNIAIGDTLICDGGELNVNPLSLGITVDNGLTLTGSLIKLGGTLSQPTTITTSGTNTLTLAGLVSNSNPTGILTTSNTGATTVTTLAALATSVSNTITANNGLTKTGSLIQLGGSLIQNTTVNTNGYKLSLKDTGFGTGLQIIPGTASPTNWTTADVSIFTGKLSVVDNAKFSSNVGVGISPDTNLTTGTKLYSYKQITSSIPSIVGISTTVNEFSMFNDVVTGNLNNIGYIAGATNILNFYPNIDAVTAANSFESYYTGGFNEFVYGSGGVDTTSYGTISATASRGYFIYSASIDMFISNRIMTPIHDASGYYGSVTTMIGLQIDDQRLSLDGATGNGVIGTSYGIRQSGADDLNLFNGHMILQKVLASDYVNDTAAAAGGVPVGALYHTSGIVKIRLV